MKRIRRHLAAASLAFAVGASTALAAQDSGGPMVAVQDNTFNPAQSQIAAGSTVTWTNQGGNQHTITADDGSFDSGLTSPGDTFSFTFAAPGTYPFYCSVHGGPGGQGMSGVIVVS